MTTVGYGDIAPTTVLGQISAAGLMVLGYAIIAVPTGIVSAELVQAAGHQPVSTQACPACSAEGHDADAVCCNYCGEHLYPDASA
jgi:voltage-gated potassium channel